MSRFAASISSAISEDPGLPRPNPTVSAWQVPEHTIASIQSATLPEYTDFAVIGSGITGCSATKALLEHEHEATRNAHITVLEARTLVSGATGRNGGHLVTASGHTFGPLARQHGVRAAKQITRFSIINIEHVMKMVRGLDPQLQEDCQIRDVLKVMIVADEETWAAAKQSVLEFQKEVPEYSSYHRIVEREHVAEVSLCCSEAIFDKLVTKPNLGSRGGMSRMSQGPLSTKPAPSGHTGSSRVCTSGYCRSTPTVSPSRRKPQSRKCTFPAHRKTSNIRTASQRLEALSEQRRCCTAPMHTHHTSSLAWPAAYTPSAGP